MGKRLESGSKRATVRRHAPDTKHNWRNNNNRRSARNQILRGYPRPGFGQGRVAERYRREKARGGDCRQGRVVQPRRRNVFRVPGAAPEKLVHAIRDRRPCYARCEPFPINVGRGLQQEGLEIDREEPTERERGRDDPRPPNSEEGPARQGPTTPSGAQPGPSGAEWGRARLLAWCRRPSLAPPRVPFPPLLAIFRLPASCSLPSSTPYNSHPPSLYPPPSFYPPSSLYPPPSTIYPPSTTIYPSQHPYRHTILHFPHPFLSPYLFVRVVPGGSPDILSCTANRSLLRFSSYRVRPGEKSFTPYYSLRAPRLRPPPPPG